MASKNGSSSPAVAGSLCASAGSEKSLLQTPDPHKLDSAQPTQSESREVDGDRDDPQQKAEMKGQVAQPEKAAPGGMIERSLQAQLGRQLRTIFADVAQEPVPNRFVRLLEELEAREKRR